MTKAKIIETIEAYKKRYKTVCAEGVIDITTLGLVLVLLNGLEKDLLKKGK